MSVVVPVILCGGAGTRLWPLSRSDRPKQFISLFGDRTLLEETLLRARTIAGASEPICVTAAPYGAEVRQSLNRLGLQGRLLLEPEPRNTAPAICAAALVAVRSDPTAVIVALPSDHVLEDGGAFEATIAQAVAAAEGGWITILGVLPRHASTALGYIVPAEAIDALQNVYRVSRFVEKPEEAVARGLITAGGLWNAGMVVARADSVVAAVRKHEPALLAAVERSLANGRQGTDELQLNPADFAEAPRISFDNAVLERHGSIAVTALDASWRDVGTWVVVAELYPPDGDGNRKKGRVQLSASNNSFVFSPHRLTVGIGLKDVFVIDTPDALLIAKREDLGQLRDVVEMALSSFPEVGCGDWNDPPPRVHETAITHASDRVRRIALVPGETTRREPHGDVSRHWIILEGQVQVMMDGHASNIMAKHCFSVPPGVAHTIENVGQTPVTLVEVHLIETIER